MKIETQSIRKKEVLKWPDLPIGLKNGVKTQTDTLLVVGLGSLGQTTYVLDTEAETLSWEKGSDFIGPDTNGAAHATVDGALYVFGGSGKIANDDIAPVIFESAYKYNIAKDTWTLLPTKTPVGLLGAQATHIGDGIIAFFGGYNKGLFDSYLYQVSTTDSKSEPEKWNNLVQDFMGMPPESYFWNKEVLTYDTRNNVWASLGTSPYLPNCGAATVWYNDQFHIIGGEIKPGLRTPLVKTLSFNEKGVKWTNLSELPVASNMKEQEGVAGAFAGTHNGAIIVIGGSNFKGARESARQGQWFAHEGKPKAYNPESYVFDGSTWTLSTPLPNGISYGSSFELKEGLLLVGGENTERTATTSVVLVKWDGKKLNYID